MSHVKDTNATKTKNEKTKVIIEKIFLTILSPPWVYYSIKAAENQGGALYIINFARNCISPTRSVVYHHCESDATCG